MIPLPWKIGATLGLFVTLATAGAAYRHHVYQRGFDTATSERAARDAVAVVTRTQDNAAQAIQQSTFNAIITKAKNEELAPVRARIAAERVRVGAAICGSAGAAQADDASRGDISDPPGRLVRPDVDRDIRALKLAVEEDLATGRACQAFGRQNGFWP